MLKCRNKMNLNNGTSNKSCQPCDFPNRLQYFFQLQYKLQLHLQTSFSSRYQSSLWQKFDLTKSTSNKNHGQIKSSLQFQVSEYVHPQVLCQIQQQIRKALLSSFLHNFKLKTVVINDQKSMLVTVLNRFEVIGLLYFHKDILPSHGAKFLFQKLRCV